MLPGHIHRYIYLFGLLSLSFGMMVGTVPTSVPQLILLGNWLVEMDFKRKWQQLRSNRLFWVCGAVFFIHVLGLLYTQNLKAGWDDVRTKIPLLFLPLVFFTNAPLSRREFHGVLACFLAGSVVNTAWCVIYSFILHHNEVGRNASRFMSHIRLGLYLNMAIAACLYFVSTVSGLVKKAGLLLLALYFLGMMYVLGLASGLVNFFILLLLAVGVLVYRQRLWIKLVSLAFLTGCIAFTVNYISTISNNQLELNDTPNNRQMQFSPSGRPYNHFDAKGHRENGNYVFINIQLEELRDQWKRLFPADSFNYKPYAHNINRYVVLVRYLASKGLNKDSVGISQLSEEDRQNILKNVCNYKYPQWNYLHKRIYELVCEYDDFLNKRDVNGHSLTMRLYFWQAAVGVIDKYPVMGVGTGDVQAELNRVYEESNSPLDPEWYKRPHNQFLTVMVALGAIGLAVLLLSLVWPVVVLRRHLHALYWPFFVMAIVSFLIEDTLETQAGLSFYAVFNALFISKAWFESKAGAE